MMSRDAKQSGVEAAHSRQSESRSLAASRLGMTIVKGNESGSDE